jgi:uncharacterized C2H2 Zn-finger protein
MDEQEMQGGVVCDRCGATFETQDELDRHMQETHADVGMEEGTQEGS